MPSFFSCTPARCRLLFGHNIVRRRPAPSPSVPPFLALTAVLAIAISIARSRPNSFGRLPLPLPISLPPRARSSRSSLALHEELPLTIVRNSRRTSDNITPLPPSLFGLSVRADLESNCYKRFPHNQADLFKDQQNMENV